MRLPFSVEQMFRGGAILCAIALVGFRIAPVTDRAAIGGCLGFPCTESLPRSCAGQPGCANVLTSNCGASGEWVGTCYDVPPDFTCLGQSNGFCYTNLVECYCDDGGT